MNTWEKNNHLYPTFATLMSTLLKIISVCLLLSGWLFVTHAQIALHTDCALIYSYQDAQSSGEDPFDTISMIVDLDANQRMPREWVDAALRNLHAYCCHQRYLTDDYCQTSDMDVSSVVPSAFLFDHLIDVGLRRLDSAADTTYGAAINDPQWAERRIEMRKLATSETGNPASTFINLYNDYWWAPLVWWIVSATNAWNNPRYCDALGVSPASELNLRQKYTNQCNIALCLYQDIMNRGTSAYQLQATTRLKQWFDNCQAVTRQRILDELHYVLQTITQQSNQFFLHHNQSYTQTYFVWSRFSRLADKWFRQINQRDIVNRKVVEGTRQCSL